MPKSLLSFHDLLRHPFANHVRAGLVEAGFDPAPDQHHPLAMFEPNAMGAWVLSVLKFLVRRKHPFAPAEAAPNHTSCYAVPDVLRVSVAGDWGTGTDEADAVAREMMRWNHETAAEAGDAKGEAPDLTIHLGDVYYVGGEKELRENCLGGEGTHSKPEDCTQWPVGALGSFALSGNHEMYAKGRAYFKTFLSTSEPRLGMKDAAGKLQGQGVSFFCLENAAWRIIGLDTGYNSVTWLGFESDCRLEDELMRWLRETVNPQANPKATVLMSHHQYFSAFLDGKKPEDNFPGIAAQLAEIFGDTPLVWLWGHEHRLSGYELGGPGKLQVFGRCLGHGGMPVKHGEPDAGAGAGKPKALFYDLRENPSYKDSRIGLNGFVELAFDGEKLVLRYKSVSWDGKRRAPVLEWLMEETFQASGGAVQRVGCRKLTGDEKFVVLG